ncbi:pickpocket protein 19 [Drosophila innubila]|uniref:pickpocket protein 19 n=1 Tax=Drosophila innubila TaxID=198719 RepID=UPI00148D88AC|nr:pickpocket protein 19 [Drosophila innubila]
MFYPQELFPRPRARPPLNGSYNHGTGLLQPKDQSQFKSHRSKVKRGKFLRLMIPYLRGYCTLSSVHGFRYLTDPKLRVFERFIWLLILVGTFICATIVYVDLAALYNSERTQTTIENTMTPIFYVPFPSVGLCMLNRVNWFVLENEASDIFLGVNASKEKKEIFKHFFAAVSNMHFNNMRSLSNFFRNESLAAGIGELDGLDVTNVLKHINLRCTDNFVECNWRSKPYNCCDLFELQRTELGNCWVFNSQVSTETRQRGKEDKYYPRRNAQNGPGSGLQVYIRRNKSLSRSSVKGVHVMIKQPGQWSDSTRLLPPDSNNRISVMPRFTGSDERTRSLSPRTRHCVFPDEIMDPLYKNLPGFVYWRGNCRSRCHQEYVVKLCNCSPSLFFPIHKDDNFTDCKASEFKCLYDHRMTFSVERLALESEYVDDVYTDSMTCDCLNSCSQLVYDTIHSSSAMDDTEIDKEMDSIHIDVFFQSPWFIKYQTHMRFTFVELLASFGGIIGLFLGASLLSAIEVIYYFTIGLYLYLFDGRRKTNQQEVLQPTAPPITLHFRRKITPNKMFY